MTEPQTPHPSGLTEQQISDLLAAAEAVAANAYAPYSKFRVGAAILLADGSIYTGCNVENASYGLANCAERTAIFKAISERGPGISLRAVMVTNLNQAACSPCGPCRQVLIEFGNANTWVFFPDETGLVAVPLNDLLPFAFKLLHD
ncbi:MAG: cytidine deaminase [Acidobacteriaceae bacterium]